MNNSETIDKRNPVKTLRLMESNLTERLNEAYHVRSGPFEITYISPDGTQHEISIHNFFDIENKISLTLNRLVKVEIDTKSKHNSAFTNRLTLYFDQFNIPLSL